jgi:glycosyltransferase involved in cell wall biosynthesis
MHFMFVAPERVSGGAERVFSLFANTLVQLEHQVTFVQYEFNDEDYFLDPRVTSLGIPNYKRTEKAITGIPRRAHALRRIIKQIEPDVIIPILAYTQIEAFLATRGLKTKLISAIRNNPAFSPARKIERIVRDVLCCFSDGIAVQTETQRDYFPRYLWKKIFVISNPVGEQFVNSRWLPHDSIRQIVNVGRLNAQKNQSLFIEAMQIIHEKHPDIQGAIYGEGPEQAALEKKIIDLALQNVIVLKGRVSDLPVRLLESDIFVLCSDFEGYPNALIEAMAMGIPSISTDCPTGPKEIIRQGENGLLVKCGDAEELAAAAEWMITHYEDAIQMGSFGRQQIQNTLMPESVCRYLVQQCSRIVEKKKLH